MITAASTRKIKDLLTAIEIRRKADEGVRPKALAAQHGVDVSTIYAILRGAKHAPNVTVPLDDDTVVLLERSAKRAGTTRAAHAADLLRRALSDKG
jgi:hypothetical protein